MVRSFPDRPYITNAFGHSRVRQVSELLWTLTPMLLVPGVSRPGVSRLNARLLGRQIRRSVRRLGLRDVLLWVYPPEFVHAVARVPHTKLVADLVDDFVEYEVEASRKAYVRTCTRELMAAADVALCTTGGLAQTYRPEASVVPNGYDAELFDAGTTPVPGIRSTGPVVGFVGTMFRYLDYDLLGRIAEEIPGLKLVLVGRIADNSPQLARLLAKDNVMHVGPVAREQVPGYIASFDVCLVPFKVDALSRNVSPLKAYEYLAMGKPVVSVPMPSLGADPAAASVVYAEDQNEFVAAVRSCIDSPDAYVPDAEQVRQASWDGRFETARHAVEPLLAEEPR